MSDHQYESLTADELQQIDSVAEQFERALHAGREISIESQLSDYPESIRRALVVELIAIEVEGLSARGQTPSRESYCERFDTALVEQGFENANLSATDDQTLSISDQGFSDQFASIDTAHQPEELTQIAHYEIEELLGRGGMGMAYRAWDPKLKRTVAIKLLTGNHDPQYVARFKAEAEAIARLQHDGIVRIYEVGLFEARHYIVLEYIDGGTLGQWIGNEPKPARECARLLYDMALAISFAHENEVLHRDLKPANILLRKQRSRSKSDSFSGSSSATIDRIDGSTVHTSTLSEGSHDGDSGSGASRVSNRLSPKITDFGLAKLQGESDNEITQTGVILGTPAYMSPEQAGGNPRDVGPRSDIYGLGATLYAMLTGRAPFVAESPVKILQLVANESPVPPRQLQPDIPRDLETICLKCLEKEPTRRYISAEQLAHDLENFLSNKPITAKPAGIARRVQLFAQRNKGLCIVSTLLISALIMATGIYIRSINAAMDRAIAGERDANRQKNEVTRQREEVLRQYSLSNSRMLAARSASLRDENPVRSLLFGIEAVEITKRMGQSVQPQVYQNLIMRVSDIGGEPLIGHRHSVMGLVISPDGKTLHSAGMDKTMVRWDLSANPTEKLSKINAHPGRVTCLAQGPDARQIVTGCYDGIVRIWSEGSDEAVELPTGDNTIVQVAVSPGGEFVAAGCLSSDVFLWDLRSENIAASRQALNSLAPVRNSSLTFSPDGRWLAASFQSGNARARGTAVAWDMAAPDVPESGTQLYHDAAGCGDLDFSGDGRWLAIGRNMGTVDLWDVSEALPLSPTFSLEKQDARISCLDFSHSCDMLASCDADGVIALWDIQSEPPSLREKFYGERGLIRCLAFHPDDHLLATGSASSSIRVWDMEQPGRYRTLRGLNSATRCLLFTPDGRRLIAGDNNKDIRIWSSDEIVSGALPEIQHAHTQGVSGLTLVGDAYYSCGREGQVFRWNDGDPEPQLRLKPQRTQLGNSPVLHRVVSSPARELIAVTAFSDAAIRIWNLAFEKPRQRLLRQDRKHPNSLALDDSGQVLATANADGILRLFDVSNLAQKIPTICEIQVSQMPLHDVTFLPGSATRVATVSKDGALQIWDTSDDVPLIDSLALDPPSKETGSSEPSRITIAEDGTLAAVSTREAVALVPLIDGQKLGQPTYLGGDFFTSVALSHDQEFLVAGDSQGKIHMWFLLHENVQSTEIILSGHEDWITALHFKDDDAKLYSASRDGTIRKWELRVEELLAVARRVAGRELSPEERKQFPEQILEGNNDSIR